jgi:hypothetical protein
MLSKVSLLNKFLNILPNIECDLDVYFEHFSMDGLKEMHQYSKDKSLYEFFEFDRFITIDETKVYIENLLNRMSSESKEQNSMYWFVRRLLGFIENLKII